MEYHLSIGYLPLSGLILYVGHQLPSLVIIIGSGRGPKTYGGSDQFFECYHHFDAEYCPSAILCLYQALTVPYPIAQLALHST